VAWITAFARQQEVHANSANTCFISKRLGSGGFGIVFEVEEFNLVLEDASGDPANDDDAADGGDGGDDAADGSSVQQTRGEEVKQQLKELFSGDKDGATTAEDHEHYDVRSARKIMAERCLRNGQARYALKHLRKDLSEIDRARGTVDLAIEISFLRALWHPNIIKMRGISDTERISPDTFLILDRLFGTLEDKYDQWNVRYKANKGGPAICGRRGRNEEALQELLKDQLVVAYDLTQAFRYLHQQK